MGGYNRERMFTVPEIFCSLDVSLAVPCTSACNCVCVCYGFNIYTGLYTSMGHYNRELSVRWSFGSLYARG